ncbi:Stp1/IreP family PP2C-type Ser/Thr phosphatase [Acidaminobacter hydrogenoformans]|uniref:Protein phosphatase n=1 Tax=Acidaminobacter hydrogenoformans DSM 2784 TaxID=1120920 RepID=A0A1G5RT06_9FIRM|nr:Stp1/IreP family PP2C-type Ser/Thr phosphatase [Acidaminobacter hydrogenoformans]SCZ76958.1 protein phosphatase [Acidaminobacter hydrogenoformans DSM 2784]
MKTAGLSHIGKIRTNNEDAYYIDEKLHLIAVADGMGGHKAGEIASGIAVEALASMNQLAQNEALQPAEIYRQVFSDANQKIWVKAHESEDCKGMGTTLTSVWIQDGLAYVAHIGDSRAYRMREGILKQVTRDHTLVEELIKNGSIDREAALSHPQKNVLMKAVGADDRVTPDLHEIEAQAGDLFLLCSDGLTHYLKAEEINEILTAKRTLEERLSQLVELALERGGADNITAVAIELDGQGGETQWTES